MSIGEMKRDSWRLLWETVRNARILNCSNLVAGVPLVYADVIFPVALLCVCRDKVAAHLIIYSHAKITILFL